VFRFLAAFSVGYCWDSVSYFASSCWTCGWAVIDLCSFRLLSYYVLLLLLLLFYLYWSDWLNGIALLWATHFKSYGASPVIWDRTVLSATRHRWTCPALIAAIHAGTRFTYPGGMEGWVDLGVGYIPRWLTCPQTVTHPGSNHLMATRPGVEPTTSWSQVQRANRYSTKVLMHQHVLYGC